MKYSYSNWKLAFLRVISLEHALKFCILINKGGGRGGGYEKKEATTYIYI